MSHRGTHNPETDMPTRDPNTQPSTPGNPIPEGGVGISPRVDLVFQRIFGAPGHEPLLIDLLNSVLRPERPVVAVRLLNPVLSPTIHEGRLVIVDLVAMDDRGAQVQVEMQTTAGAHLRPRMLHGWANLYGRQLSAGQGFGQLRPVISVWFCDRDVLPPPPPSRAAPGPSTPALRSPRCKAGPPSSTTSPCTWSSSAASAPPPRPPRRRTAGCTSWPRPRAGAPSRRCYTPVHWRPP